MDIDDADRFRRQAVVCREKSDKARSLVDAANWLRLADDFEKLASRKPDHGAPTATLSNSQTEATGTRVADPTSINAASPLGWNNLSRIGI